MFKAALFFFNFYIFTSEINPDLVGGGARGGGGEILLPCWFSLNNSETVKALTLAFCSIQKHFKQSQQ